MREGLYQIATVGDDNAIAVLRLALTGTADSLQLLILCTECNAHASSITGENNIVILVGKHFACCVVIL